MVTQDRQTDTRLYVSKTYFEKQNLLTIYILKILKRKEAKQNNFADPISLSCVMTYNLENTDLAYKQGEE